ncbi:MAG: tRNA pseudouridine(55) synthase TruB [Treponemataceae bacterium]|nr:tRNA pseudouridine(55) synthase TruB [Treponemataceae bacterium]
MNWETDVSGLVLVHKVEGYTSFETLQPIKKYYKTSKVGHAGTLDRFASGLLVVAVGRATRLLPYFTSLDKWYEATVRFGKETTTLDPEGEVTREGPSPSLEDLQRALNCFRGTYDQVPPAYSALHVQGMRASERMRKGESFELTPRPVTIYTLQLLDFTEGRARLLIHCSKGTYIRSLARDLAREAASCAYVEQLCRLAVGPFHLRDAVPLSGEKGFPLQRPSAELARSLGMEVYCVSDEAIIRAIQQGAPLHRYIHDLPEKKPLVALVQGGGELLAILHREGSLWRYGCVYDHP